MTEIGTNRAKARLAAREIVLCMGVNQMRTPNIGMLAASAGFDAIYIDMEHNPTDLETMAGMCIGALGAGVTPIVRTAILDPGYIGRILDVGAQGIMLAHINNAEEAQRLVSACLFRPHGRRSAAGTLPSLGYKAMSQGEVTRVINQETLIMAMIETEEGLANVQSIAAVPGLNTLHIGANDLSVELDLPGDVEHPRLREAYAKVAEAAFANGLSMGVGATGGHPALQADLLRLGVRYLTCGIDINYVLAGGRADTKAIREMKF
jgi:2-keto-3-deoxy-L-rhamnonate aldolase RhmA